MLHAHFVYRTLNKTVNVCNQSSLQVQKKKGEFVVVCPRPPKNKELKQQCETSRVTLSLLFLNLDIFQLQESSPT